MHLLERDTETRMAKGRRSLAQQPNAQSLMQHTALLRLLEVSKGLCGPFDPLIFRVREAR